MQRIEDPVEPITLGTSELGVFDDIAVAHLAVQTVAGTDHPLLQRTQKLPGRGGDTLRDALEKPDHTEPQTFYDGNARTIRHSLQVIARPESRSIYPNISPLQQNLARMVLGTPVERQPAETMHYPDEPDEPADATQTELWPLPRAPHRLDGEIVEGHIMLNGMGELMTALRVVNTFMQDEVQKREIAGQIEAVMDNSPTLNVKPHAFFGPTARGIYDTLTKAADPDAELYDLDAAYLLHGTKPENTPAPEASEAEPRTALAA